MTRAWIHTLFFLSGISGLVYQVVWVRQFGNVFGNTVYSASVVSALFLCGLGIGGYWVGRFSDRQYDLDPGRPLRLYGVFELLIAALGLTLALVLARIEVISAAISSYTQASNGWYELTAGTHAMRYATAVVLLAPITFLMGGTLTLLIRHFVARDLSRAGWRIGLLYGVNTLGAAVGAFLSDFSLIPSLGIMNSVAVAASLNAGAGVAALLIARGRRTTVLNPEAADVAEAVEAGKGVDAHASFAPALVGIALFLSGLSTIGMEIVWLRFLISHIGAYRSVFSLLLTVILLGIFGGSLLGGWIERRYGRPARLFMWVQVAFVVTVILQLANYDLLLPLKLGGLLGPAYAGASPALRLWLQTLYNLVPIVSVVAGPALLMGFAFPLANACVQRTQQKVGRRAGALYLTNTLGNVAGALLTGFVLLPTIGMHASVTVLMCCSVLSLLPLYLAARSEAERRLRIPVRAFGACVALPIIAIVSWAASFPSERLILPTAIVLDPDRYHILTLSEGINESIIVMDEEGAGRNLVTNGHAMSSDGPRSRRYMRLFSHLPLLQMDSPERVLVICVGVGNTLYAASLHPTVKRLDAVDLSRHVVEHTPYFRLSNHDVLDDPRVSVYINDGRQHLRMLPGESYDLITLEPPPIAYAGVSSLYSREFYELVHSRLSQGGYFTQWLPSYQVSGEANLAIIRSFLDVFPGSILLSGHDREFILVGVKEGVPHFDPQQVAARIRSNPALRKSLAEIEAESLTSLVGTFVAGAETLEQATRNTLPVTDDYPIIEYSSGATLFDMQIPRSLFQVSDVRQWCPDCFEEGADSPLTPGLSAYLRALEACYFSRAFSQTEGPGSKLRHPIRGGPGGVSLPRDREVSASIRGSRYLRRIFLADVSKNDGWARRSQPCAVEYLPVP